MLCSISTGLLQVKSILRFFVCFFMCWGGGMGRSFCFVLFVCFCVEGAQIGETSVCDVLLLFNQKITVHSSNLMKASKF